MRFQLIDDILEDDADHVVAIKQVSMAEEYLGDHFPGFPVLPGVLMLEAMVQAARQMLGHHTGERLVLGSVRALKYGAMVRPGEMLRVEVTLDKTLDGGLFACRGTGIRHRPGTNETDTAVSGRFTMRPIWTAADDPRGSASPPPAAPG